MSRTTFNAYHYDYDNRISTINTNHLTSDDLCADRWSVVEGRYVNHGFVASNSTVTSAPSSEPLIRRLTQSIDTTTPTSARVTFAKSSEESEEVGESTMATTPKPINYRPWTQFDVDAKNREYAAAGDPTRIYLQDGKPYYVQKK